MLIPHLHFSGNCKEAIPFYEKAFNTRADVIISNSRYTLKNMRMMTGLPMQQCVYMANWFI